MYDNMEKILTEEQRRMSMVLDTFNNSEWWRIIKEVLEKRLNDTKSILLWDMKLQDDFIPWRILNIDEIRYSKASKLRDEKKTLEDILNLPNTLMNGFGIYQEENNGAK